MELLINEATLKPNRRTLDAAKADCPVELAIRIIGGKWKPVILWHLKTDKKRFGELKKLIGGITVKMLTQQLRELEQDGIVSRKMYYEVPPRVEYSLTSVGHSLEPVLSAMCDWGNQYKVKVLGQTVSAATAVTVATAAPESHPALKDHANS